MTVCTTFSAAELLEEHDYDRPLVVDGVRCADAAALVACIQQDEAPHVGYLTTALAELRCRELAAADGGTVSGRAVIDRARDMLVAFQTGPRHQANVELRTQVTERALDGHPRRTALLDEFRALAS